MKCTIVLADDHELVGKSIAALLREELDFEVIGECRNGRELVGMVGRLRPNVAIVDVAMPEMNGIEVSRRLKEVSRTTRVIILTNYMDEAYLRGALEAGVVGYVLKSGAADDLIRAIRKGTRGNVYLSAELGTLAERLRFANASDSPRTDGDGRRRHPLSPRECEVLQLIAEGNSTAKIASKLGIRESTIKDHRKHIKEKLDIHDIAGLTRYAISIGMIRAGT